MGWGTDTVLVFHLGVVRRERLVYEDSANCMYTYVFPVFHTSIHFLNSPLENFATIDVT